MKDNLILKRTLAQMNQFFACKKIQLDRANFVNKKAHQIDDGLLKKIN